jgi:hypothetical protein
VRTIIITAVFAAAMALAPAATAAPPSCPAASFTVNSGESLHLVGACTDPDGDALSYAIVPETGPGHGSLIIGSANDVTYRSNLGYSGPDGFSYSASDGTTTVTVPVAITVVIPPGGGGLPPQCPQTDLFVSRATTVHLVSQCTDPEGGAAQVVGFTPPAGTLTPTGPGEADYTPPATGDTDSFTFTVSDGFNSTTSTVHITITDGSGPFSTAPEATPAEPLVAALTLPGSSTGTVTVSARPATDAPPAGFFLFGTAFTIEAPAGSAASPLVLRFTVDGSQAPAGQLVAVRDGVAIESECTGAGASPDPCFVAQPPVAPGEDQTVVVRSSHASKWALAVHATYPFRGYLPLKWDSPALNAADPGDVYPIVFGLGGDQGLDVLAAGTPSSREISCTTGAPVGPETAATSLGRLFYVRALDVYSYVWRTDKKWKKTCRAFTLRLDDGSVHSARFRFGKN